MPPAIEYLPHINVSLNALATLLLLLGLYLARSSLTLCGISGRKRASKLDATDMLLIKRKRERAHRNVMLTAFGVNVVFLASYLTYHAYAGSKPFPTDPQVAPLFVRYFYYIVLLTHILLAAVAPLLAIGSIYLGLMNKRASHRRLSVITWPVWFYVSVTGIIVYLMLYQIYTPLEVG